MNKFIFSFALLAFCALVESGIVNIEFPDGNFVSRVVDGKLQLFADHTSFFIKAPKSSKLFENSESLQILPLKEAFSNKASGASDELLVKGSKKLEAWLHSSNLTHSTTIHLFNVTNTKQLYGDSVQLVGPFKFSQERTYTVDHWTSDEQFVVVKQSKKYQLIDKTNHLLERPITILNAPLIALYEAILRLDTFGKNHAEFKKALIDLSLQKLPLFVTVKVKDLLFGYSDATLEMISDVKQRLRELGFNLILPNSIQNGQYSVMGAMSSAEPMLKVNTGKANIQDLGQIAGMNGYDRNRAWRNDSQYDCQKFEGSDGMLRGPLGDENSIKLFVPEMDRPVELEQVSFDGTVDNGERVRKYVWSENTFKSSKNHPPNSCYHNYTWLIYEDIDGIMTKSRNTSKNEQLVFSQPLYLGKEGRSFFEALVPDRKVHDSFIEIAETGETIRERRSLQINVDTGLINNKIPRLFFPIYYFSDESIVDLERLDTTW